MKNDAKYEFYSNHKAMDVHKDAAKRDEELMLKSIVEREAKIDKEI